MKLKAAFFEIESWEKAYIQKNIRNADILFFENALTENDIPKIKDCSAISVFIYSKITREPISWSR